MGESYCTKSLSQEIYLATCMRLFLEAISELLSESEAQPETLLTRDLGLRGLPLAGLFFLSVFLDNSGLCFVRFMGSLLQRDSSSDGPFLLDTRSSSSSSLDDDTLNLGRRFSATGGAAATRTGAGRSLSESLDPPCERASVASSLDDTVAFDTGTFFFGLATRVDLLRGFVAVQTQMNVCIN